MGIRIDALDPAASAADDHELPAMKDDVTVKLTVAQISTKVQSDLSDELAAKAPLASPAFTGNPTAPTQAGGNSSTRLATTAFVQGELAADTLTAKTTPVDADLIRIADSADDFVGKKLTFANLWSWISGKTLTLFNASGSAPVYACRAWVNFNGTGTVAIRASGNVSSITDNGVGDYTVNLTTAMPDSNYAVCVSQDRTGSNTGTFNDHNFYASGTPVSASAARVFGQGTAALTDCAVISVGIFR